MEYQRIVAFKFKPGLPESAVRRHFDHFAELKSRIPQILSYRAGRTVPLGAEAPGRAPEFDAFHYLTFAGTREIDEYFLHPEHLRFVEVNRGSWERVLVLNGEISVSE